ncbi:hypothetical protein [Sphingomonas lacusdianchii]|uniref:hypothetical protein n=1 Tax=Sphingomonas lacusdianchii TaxID=2917992 RepID=UPI001F584E6A|nr:hypothetical protein [Sphingomonas sp. JXJ CY 53]
MYPKYLIGAFVALVSLASPAASQDEDAPHRIAINRLALTGDPVEVGSCAMRLLGRSAKVTSYPVRDGVGLDWTPKSGFLMSAPGDPIVSMEFRSDAQGAYLVGKYRHPFSRKTALTVFEKASEKCFAIDWEEWKSSQDSAK